MWPLWSGSAVQPPTSLNQGHQPSLRSTQPLMLFSVWAPGPPSPVRKGVNQSCLRTLLKEIFLRPVWGQQPDPATPSNPPFEELWLSHPQGVLMELSIHPDALHHWCVMQLTDRSTPSALCSDSSEWCETLQVISTFSLIDPLLPKPAFLSFSISVNDNSISSCCSGKKS